MRGLIIDCFAGGGGASVGIEMALGRPVDIAINHDPEAIRMHMVNHPDTIHLTEDIFKVDLQEYVKGRHVDLMWASPDCTHFSKAKGGKPRSKEIRMLPFAVVKHAKAVRPDVIIMENVEEIQQWGPLDQNGHPIKERQGETYRSFIRSMEELGYTHESRELVAADYGAPTTRRRWYAIFRCDGRQIRWPAPTHDKDGANGKKKWVPVSSVLNFDDLGKSIFGRKKPLAEKTMRRIARGLDKFVLNCPDPFIVQVKKDATAPYMIQYHSETAKHEVRGQDVRDPIMTLDCSNRYGLVSAFLTKFYKTGIGQDIREPIHTITTSPGHFGQINILMTDWKHLEAAGVDRETAQKCTWVSEFIMEYYGCGTGQQVTEPMHTIVTKDRFALITVLGNEYVILDILLRMLSPEELKRAQGFPEDYIIDRDINYRKYPTKEQVAKIGNSVVPMMAKALVQENAGYLKIGERRPNISFHTQPNGQIAFA